MYHSISHTTISASERNPDHYEAWNDDDDRLEDMDEDEREEKMDQIEQEWDRENHEDIYGSGR